MKILHVCPRYRPDIGGVEEHVGNICERLSKKHDVTVYTTDPSGNLPEHEIVNDVNVTRFPSWAPNDAYYFSSKLKNRLQGASSDFEIVHAHNYASFPALYAAQAKAENVLFFTPHYHGTGHTFLRSLFHRPYKIWGKKIFEKAEKVVCVSNFEKNLLLRDFGRLEEKLVLVPNGFNVEEFANLEKGESHEKKILCVSRLERYKGIQYVIQALPLLSDSIGLEIVGTGGYRDSLVEMAERMNLQERVKFYEGIPRKELLQKYVDASVFILLSEHESYGISVGEALCAGTPCIVANKSALTEWVDGEQCFGIDYPIDVDRLARLVNEVISKRIDVRCTGLWSWDDVVMKLSNLYENSIS